MTRAPLDEGRLHDDHDARHRGDETIAAGEVPRVRWRARRMLGPERPRRRDLARERVVLGRVDDVHSAAEHRERGAAARERAGVRRRVDAPGEPGDDDDAAAGEVLGEAPRDAQAVRGGPARADDRRPGDRGVEGQAPRPEGGGAVGRRGERGGVVGVGGGERGRRPRSRASRSRPSGSASRNARSERGGAGRAHAAHGREGVRRGADHRARPPESGARAPRRCGGPRRSRTRARARRGGRRDRAPPLSRGPIRRSRNPASGGRHPGPARSSQPPSEFFRTRRVRPRAHRPRSVACRGSRDEEGGSCRPVDESPDDDEAWRGGGGRARAALRAPRPRRTPASDGRGRPSPDLSPPPSRTIGADDGVEMRRGRCGRPR